MNYTVFKLSYIMHLQKKYYPVFKLGNENIYVLPPIFKRKGLSISLAFPVAKRLGKNFVSRPVGVILVNKNAKERFYDMSEFEFTSFSQDFEKKYEYKTYQQEYLKVTLNLLASCYPKFPCLMKKDYSEKYLPRLKNSFEEEYWNFYEDLISNKFSRISKKMTAKREIAAKKKVKDNRKSSQKDSSDKKEMHLELKKFVKKEIWSAFEDEKLLSKLIFLELFGKVLREKVDFENKKVIIRQKKVEAAKAYARSVNFEVKDQSHLNRLSKQIFNILDAILMEEKDKKVDETSVNQIKKSCAVLEKELPKVKEERTKLLLSSYFNRLMRDYSTVEKKRFSHILFAYLFLFLD